MEFLFVKNTFKCHFTDGRYVIVIQKFSCKNERIDTKILTKDKRRGEEKKTKSLAVSQTI